MNSVSPRLAAVLQWLIVLLMPIVLILSSLYVFMTPQFIEWQYARPDFPPAQLFTPEARAFNAIQTVRYTRGEISEQDLINLGVYNEREIKHLVDVYNVTRVMFIVMPVALLLILGALFLLWRNRATKLYAARGLFYGGILTFVVIVAIGLFSVFAFDSFFVTFHRIFFAGDTWLFNYTDSLIQFYPVDFWMTAAYGIALFVLLGAIIVTALGGWLMRRAA
ncbi:MAG: TIGR01906 family membrane protein [Chloroflexota bacterium]|nr:MAG: TIGR01906 family membrane protein [Chloroflexota bacterium]